jgi:hypothetical protein
MPYKIVKTAIWFLPLHILIDMKVVKNMTNMIISYIKYIAAYLNHTTSHVPQEQFRCLYLIVCEFYVYSMVA